MEAGAACCGDVARQWVNTIRVGESQATIRGGKIARWRGGAVDLLGGVDPRSRVSGGGSGGSGGGGGAFWG